MPKNSIRSKRNQPAPQSAVKLNLESVEQRLAPAAIVATRQGTGVNAAALLPTVDQFRTDLGTLNTNVVNSFGGGRRDINWDAVPDTKSAPNPLPANFFNSTSPRGAVFSTPGSSFQLSSKAATAVPIDFGNINATYNTDFNAFTAERLFTAIDSNITDVNFFIPGSSTPATVTGFGAVFTDVDVAGSTKIEFYDVAGKLITSKDAPAAAGSGNLSFVGVSFSSAEVARVRIISGNAALGAAVNDITQGGTKDLVVMDDFLYGEPVLVNATLPGAQNTTTRGSVTFSAANANPFSLSFNSLVAPAPNPNAPIEVSLSAGHGIVTLASLAGLTFSVGDGAGDAKMTFSGTVANINAALNGFRYNPTGDFFGTDSLQLVLDNYDVTSSVNINVTGEKQYAVGPDKGTAGVVRFFNNDGSERFASDVFPGFTGGVRVASADFNKDGISDIVVGTGPGIAAKVRVLDGKTQAELFTVNPFDTFTGGVFVAAGDITGDGAPDLVITPDLSGGPRVRIFSGDGFGQVADFFGINDVNFRGGARAAVGDVNGDGKADLIVAAGYGGGPRVALFSGSLIAEEGNAPGQTTARWEKWKLLGDFFGFEPSLRDGMFVTAGDLDADGKSDIFFGAGPGGGPRVRVASGSKLLALAPSSLDDAIAAPIQIGNFFAGDTNSRGGIRIAVKDIDGDNKADLLTAAGTGVASVVTAYAGKNISSSGTPPTLRSFEAYPSFTGGVFVG